MRHYFSEISVDLITPLWLALGAEYGVQIANAMLIIDGPENVSAADLDRILANVKLSADHKSIRMERDALLAACDWTQSADSPLSAENKAAWAVYRKALRDLPASEGFPNNYQWPLRPDSPLGTVPKTITLNTNVTFERITPS